MAAHAFATIANGLSRLPQEIRRTKCWTEAPDGPFGNGSRVGGGSVNMVVRQAT